MLNWIKLAPFPEPTWEMEGAVVNGRLYLFAGIVTDIHGRIMEWTPNRLVYEYDPATNRWLKKRPLPLPFHHMAIAEIGRAHV
jgi:N-acetylneuraminic acid mutarotase